MPQSGTAPERRLTGALRRALSPDLFAEIEFQPTDICPQRPDLFFRHRGPGRGGVAIFVDGCAWHGCELHSRPHSQRFDADGLPIGHALTPEGIAGTRQRDRIGRRALEATGRKVLAFWEHEIAADVGDCARRVIAALGVRTSRTWVE